MLENEHVVILHGLGRTRLSMRKVERALRAAGYRTHNVDYPSTRKTIEALAENEVAAAVARCREEGARKIHVVTHSLGGILVRHYLQHRALPRGSRIVMLAPPNQGSELAEWLSKFPPYRWILGPAASQLGTGAGSVPKSLKPITGDIGVMTGRDDAFSPFSFLFDGPSDGKVAVERAKTPEMTDFRVVDSGHTFVMNDPDVIAQILFFLRNGRFQV